MKSLGRHILVELFNCDQEKLNDPATIEEAMVRAAENADAQVINSTFHHFSPYGVSGVVVIQESHLAIHTWPEYKFAAIDIFTCGPLVDPWKAYHYLKESLGAAYGSSVEINRGQPELIGQSQGDHSHVNGDNQAPKTYKREVWFTDKDENQAVSFRHKGAPLFNKQTPYQRVRVFDTYAFGKMLTIDNMVMCTEKDEHGYHEMLIHVPMLMLKQSANVLVIGGGDGGAIREVVKHPNLEQVTMVEIDEAVVEASKLHLPQLSRAFSHPKVNLIIDDGIRFVRESPDEQYDLIIVDGSDPKGPAEGLFSHSFYEDIYRCLKPNGILCAQSESPHFNALAFKELTWCTQSIFGKEQVHTYLAFIPTYPTGMWAFTLAAKSINDPLSPDYSRSIEDFCQSHTLKYYTPEIHRAAFALPKFVTEMLVKDEEKL